LEGADIVTCLNGGAYTLGFEFHGMALRRSELMPISRAAGDVLEELRVATGENSVLGSYNRNRREMMLTLLRESPNPLRYVLQHALGSPSTRA
jgi:DNA-binding IclR family transcriptional regulator